MELRPYQITALDVLHNALQERDILLLQSATGSGKTVIIVRMIQRYFNDHLDRRFLIVMHKAELVRQFVSAFREFTNIPTSDIGICCSSISTKHDIKPRIVIASVQTMINQVADYQGADMVIIDETHRVSHDESSQYQQLLEVLRVKYQNHKVIGVTATAYRLGHGMIYGDKCRPGRKNFFPELTHRVTYKELKEQKHLMPLKGFVAAHADIEDDLKKLSVSGDYNIGEAGTMMAKHVYTAVTAYEEYGLDHNHVCVFACTIEHAEALTNVFNEAGYDAVVIHSKLTKIERHANLTLWQSGKVKIAVSINILVEGFDFPALSCLLFCRPTKSPTIFVQAIGRILRNAPGKEEALLIDLTNNVNEFGLDLDNPRFIIPKYVEGEGEAPVKVCDGEMPDGDYCGELLHASVRICPQCGKEFSQESVEELMPELKKVEFNKPYEPEPPIWYNVCGIKADEHTSKKNGKKLLKVILTLDTLYSKPFVSEYICLPGDYEGKALDFGKEKWESFTAEPYPVDLADGLWLAGDFVKPEKALCELQENGYFKLLDLDFGEGLDIWNDPPEQEGTDHDVPINFDEETPF